MLCRPASPCATAPEITLNGVGSGCIAPGWTTLMVPPISPTSIFPPGRNTIVGTKLRFWRTTSFAKPVGGGPLGTGLFMSAWTSLCVSARLYTRTSSIRPLKLKPPWRFPMLTFEDELSCEAVTVPSSVPSSSCPFR